MSKPPAPTEQPIARTSGRHWACLALAVIFVVHVFLAIRLFPTPRSIVDPDSPVVVVDHAIHEYHGALGARFLRESGRTWGYDPFFMAGYPETPVWDSSSNPSILFDLIGGGSGFRGYKVGLLTSSILVLVAIAVGAWAAGLRASEVALATGLAWFLFWTGFSIGLWRSGLFAFVSASSGVALLLGLCSRFDRLPSKLGWVALTFVGSFVFFFHVTAPILAIGGLLAFLATVWRKHGWRWHVSIFGAALIAVAVNLFWLAPLWQFRGIRTSSGLFMTTNTPWFLYEFLLYPSPEGRTSLILLILGTIGLVGWWFGGRRTSAAAFGGSIVCLILLTGFGSLWGPTKTLEPLRFRVSAFFLLTLPAASTLVFVSKTFARWVGGGWPGFLVVLGLWGGPLGCWAVFEPNYFKICWWLISNHHPLVVGNKPEIRMMVDWLKANTDLSARILFEDQLRLLELTDPESTHWTPLLPAMLEPDQRMFIGGLYQTAFIKHHNQAAFGDYQLGDRKINEWTPSEFRTYAETYNLGWVVCWSPLSRFWFDHLPSASRVATIPRYSSRNRPVSKDRNAWEAIIRRAGFDVAEKYMLEGESNYAVYRLDRPHSYFLHGKGKIVRVDPDRIELADVEPEGGAVVLSLHWLDTWKSDPPLPLKPEPRPPDPVDFLRIELPGPVGKIVLRNSRGG
jgi:hypothetical protein